MTATVRYPANEITPHGWYFLTQGQNPTIWLSAYDGSIDFYLMGGHAIPDRYGAPECVLIKRGGLKGLVPPWKHIDQKGATQDGVSNIDALIDPNEIQLNVSCRGRDGRHTRRVVRDLIGSIDAKRESQLNFFDLDAGHWWASVRWFQGSPQDPFMGGQQRRQDLSLRLRGDRGFWRTYDDTTVFRFAYETMAEEFAYTDADDLGVNWPIYFYEGSGSGFPHANGEQAVWSESGTTARAAVCGPFKDFDTDTDNQVIEFEVGNPPGIIYSDDAFNDAWGRMSRNLDGTWKGDGIRARVGIHAFFTWVELTRFSNFVPTQMFSQTMLFWPNRGEKFTLVCGVEGDPRLFRILRNGVPVLSHKEVGTNSHLGAAYRGIGFGMHAAAGQRGPAGVQRVTAGDNATVTQSGFLSRNNIGDQPMYDDLIVTGPFEKLRIWDGPGAGPDDYVEFGPLLANQTALLRTDPRDRNVYDLAAIRANPTQQERQVFDAALNGLLSFLTLSNANPLLQVIQSVFGVFGGGNAPTPPQGNFYALLSGRFSDNSAIPAKSPGNPAETYHVKVQMVGGNADSKVIASGTPLRRYPL